MLLVGRQTTAPKAPGTTRMCHKGHAKREQVINGTHLIALQSHVGIRQTTIISYGHFKSTCIMKPDLYALERRSKPFMAGLLGLSHCVERWNSVFQLLCLP